MSNHPAPPDGDAGAHGAYGPAVEDDSSPVADDRPTPLSAFIWPGLIALLVLILVWGPISNGFTTYPAGQGGGAGTGQPAATAAPTEQPAVAATIAASTPITGNAQTVIPQPTTALTAVATTVQGGGLATLSPAATAAPPTDTALPTATSVPPTDTAVPSATSAPPTDTTVPAVATAPPAPTATEVPPAPPTATTAAAAPPPADAGLDAPRAVAFGGKTFPVTISNTTIPDWIFSKDPGVANWVSATTVNYVLGISYSAANAALFARVHPSDTIRLTRADGGVLPFVVDQARRIAPSDVKPLAQDHPAITLLLLGDPAPDRALIQGHYVEATAP